MLFMMLASVLCMQAQELKKGDALPTFELKSAVYGDVKPADLKGKVVLVRRNWPMCRAPFGRSIRTTRIL